MKVCFLSSSRQAKNVSELSVNGSVHPKQFVNQRRFLNSHCMKVCFLAVCQSEKVIELSFYDSVLSK